MVLVDTPCRRLNAISRAVGVTVDLVALRQWGRVEGHAEALRELDRVGAALAASGLGDRSASRMVAILARYAFLVSSDCKQARLALWRMHVVDAVPAHVIAALTWGQVRPHLREVVAGSPGSRHYFELSRETCRLLRIMRAVRALDAGPDWVFRRDDGQPWDARALDDVLARITVR
jgi:hypothetical protein